MKLCWLKLQPTPKRVIDLLKVEVVAHADGAIDGGPRNTAHLVNHRLGRHRETGAIARRQRDAKQRCIDAVRRDGTDRDAGVCRIERV